MFTRSTALAAIRAIALVTLFMTPVGAFALSMPQHGNGLQGAGFVLFVSLQRAG